MRQTLAKLDQPTEVIENSLVATYLNQQGITIKQNKLLRQAIKAADREVVETIDKLHPSLSFAEIAAAFEIMIPQEDRQLNGAFFTPEKISSFMAQAIIETNKDTICDPSCGCGALLLAAIDTIEDKPVRAIIEENIYGVDLCDYNIRRARLLFNIHLIEKEGDGPTLKDNLLVANSLDSDFKRLFPRVEKGFDCVIGNPPYVRFQHLDERLRVDLQRFATIEDGNYNLYLPFYELGYQILSDNGRLAYITPNAFFTVKAARAFRRWALETKFIKTIYDFSDKKVFDVSAYTLIALADKKEKRSIAYARLNGADDLDKTIKTSAVPYKSLNEEKWDMLSRRQRKMIDKIESSDNIRLGDLVDIRGGVATLRDRLYLAQEHDGRIITHYKGKYYPIEAEITRPLIRISDFQNDKELRSNRRRIIFPYRQEEAGVEIIPAQELKSDYPQAWRYLKLIADELKERDKGKKEYLAFYAYGRSQGLLPPGAALLTPLYASKPRFLKSNNKEALIINGLALTRKAGYDLATLQALLDGSPVLDFYMKALGQTISGGYAHYRSDLLRRFRLPHLSKEQVRQLKGKKDPHLVEEFYRL